MIDRGLKDSVSLVFLFEQQGVTIYLFSEFRIQLSVQTLKNLKNVFYKIFENLKATSGKIDFP